jgi:hypothetical protein
VVCAVIGGGDVVVVVLCVCVCVGGGVTRERDDTYGTWWRLRRASSLGSSRHGVVGSAISVSYPSLLAICTYGSISQACVREQKEGT